MVIPGFCGPSYTLQNVTADAELCMNWFPANVGSQSQGAKAQWILQPCPGFETAASVAQSPGRGLFALGAIDNRLFGAVGFKLYEYTYNAVTETWTAVDRGDIDSDANPVTFAWNGAPGDLMFTSGGTLYAYDLGANTFAAVSALSAIDIQQVVYLNGRFLALDANNNIVYWSSLNGVSFDLGNAFSRSTAADPWVSMSVVRGSLWLLGTQTSDVYATTNDPNSPYQPIPGAYIEYGCAAAFSATNLDGRLLTVTKNANGQGQVRLSNGYELERISTDAVDYALQTYDDISDAVSFSYQEQGHYFAVINFPTADATWTYDTSSGVWHQRGYWDVDQNAYTVYRAQYYASIFGFNMVQDNTTGTLYTMSVDFFSDVDDSVIRRVRRSPWQWDGNQLNTVFFPGLQIDLQAGNGLIGQDAPIVMLNWSDDGLGFPNELTEGSGVMGARDARVNFNMLGSGRNRTWQLVCADSVPWRIVQAVYRPDPIVGVS